MARITEQAIKAAAKLAGLKIIEAHKTILGDVLVYDPATYRENKFRFRYVANNPQAVFAAIQELGQEKWTS